MSPRRLLLSLLLPFPLVAGCAVVTSARPPVAPAQTAERPAHAEVDERQVNEGSSVSGENIAIDHPFEPPAAPLAVATAATVVDAAARMVAGEVAEVEAGADDEALDDDDGEGDEEGPSGAEEAESLEGVVSDGGAFPRYTADLSDELLGQLWREDLEALGSMSVGFVDAGRLVNAVQVPRDPAWLVVSPHAAYGTAETVAYVVTAIRAVKARYPDAPPLRVNQLSGPEGGWLRPHRSHQNGRDVDLAFYYPTVEPVRARERERYIDVEKNWALVKALVTLTDVQLILVDKRVQRVLYAHALAAGEDKAWLDSLFGPTAIVRHARRHRDHFHVRFFNPRAQELGRRVAPLLALRPEQNLTFHRVRRGDTLSAIARRYGSSVGMIKSANRLRSDFLRLNVVLRVPLRGPCNRCPVPPEIVLPARRLPPAWETNVAAAPAQPAEAEATGAVAPVPGPLPQPEEAPPAGGSGDEGVVAIDPAEPASPGGSGEEGELEPAPPEEGAGDEDLATSPESALHLVPSVEAAERLQAMIDFTGKRLPKWPSTVEAAERLQAMIEDGERERMLRTSFCNINRWKFRSRETDW